MKPEPTVALDRRQRQEVFWTWMDQQVRGMTAGLIERVLAED